MSDNSNSHGLKAYAPQPKAQNQAVELPTAAEPERRDPVSGLRYYKDVEAGQVPQNETPGFFARVQSAFKNWVTGADQMPVPRPQPMRHETPALRWVDGREYVPANAPEKKPATVLSRYEDVVAERKLACADTTEPCAPNGPRGDGKQVTR